MNTITFDTLDAAQDLEAAGIERRQAEAITRTVRAASTAAREDLADLASKKDLEAAILASKKDLEAAIASLRADLYRALWVQGIGIVAIIGSFIAIAASLKLL